MPNPDSPRNPRHVTPIRLSLDEEARIRQAAERKGIPVSSYIRAAAVQQAGRDLKKAA